jgi:hypothetical protein
MTPQAEQPRDEPDWVKRLRARGFDVRGGEGNLPEEPRVSFPPMPRRRVERTVRAIFSWFLRLGHSLQRKRRHAPVP